MQSLPTYSSPQSLETTNLLSYTMNLSVLVFYIGGNIQYVTFCVCHILFIYTSVNGLLDCFLLLAIVNSTAMNICAEAFEYSFSIFLDICLVVGLLGHMVVLGSNFSEATKMFSKKVAPIYISNNNVRESQLLHILPNNPALVGFLFFLKIAILLSIKWYFIVVLIFLFFKG